MLILKEVMEKYRLKQVELAKALSLSPATIAQLLNYGIFPKSIGKDELIRSVYQWAKTQGIDTNIALFNEVVTESCNSQSQDKTSPNTEDAQMVLRKQVLTQAAKKTFKLLRNPFDAPLCADDLYFNQNARIVREELYTNIMQPRFTMLVGESGSGKTTLIQDLKSRVFKHKDQVTFIEPYVLGMEDNDLKGKTLKVAQIVEAIMFSIAPTERMPRSIESRYRMMHKRAKELANDDKRLVILIEEAHCIPKPTLKHLKRIFELKSDDGFTSLFSILLVGQPELKIRLSENDPEIREVVARCSELELLPLEQDVSSYLAYLLERANKKLDEVITQEAIEALAKKLFKRGHSRLYPLEINNIMTAALNEAAYTEQDLIYPDIIEAVAL